MGSVLKVYLPNAAFLNNLVDDNSDALLVAHYLLQHYHIIRF